MNPTDILLTKVDELGLLLARIADLTKQADAIKDELKDAATAGDTKAFEGNLFNGGSRRRERVQHFGVAISRNHLRGGDGT